MTHQVQLLPTILSIQLFKFPLDSGSHGRWSELARAEPVPAERLRPPHDPGSVSALWRMRAPRPAPPPRQARRTAGKVPGASDVSAPSVASQSRAGRGETRLWGAWFRDRPGGEGRGYGDHPEASALDLSEGGGPAGLAMSGHRDRVEYREVHMNEAGQASTLKTCFLFAVPLF